MISKNGIEWQPISFVTNGVWNSVCWSNVLNTFVSVGNGAIMSSYNGVDWVIKNSPSSSYVSICYSNELNLFVGVAQTGVQSSRVITSSLQTIPTSYNTFSSSFNTIDQVGNWTIQQVLKSGTYTSGQTTPSVSGTNLMYISNTTTPTTITNFTNGVLNQKLILIFNDSNTTIQTGTNIRLNGGVNFVSTQFDSLTLLCINETIPQWIELSRSIN